MQCKATHLIAGTRDEPYCHSTLRVCVCACPSATFFSALVWNTSLSALTLTHSIGHIAAFITDRRHLSRVGEGTCVLSSRCYRCDSNPSLFSNGNQATCTLLQYQKFLSIFVSNCLLWNCRIIQSESGREEPGCCAIQFG